MVKNESEVIICLIFLVSTGILLLINKFILILTQSFKNCNPEFSWIIHGLQNLVGYATVFVPGYFVFKYICNVNYLDKTYKGCLSFILRKCFEGDGSIEQHVSKNNLDVQPPRSFLQNCLLLSFYFIGLQTSFLTWGVLQEKIMTQNYTNIKGNIGRFTDSQFLVFVNRILAIFMSGIIILFTKQPKHKPPLYKYIYCSFSNILSSWCQYEVLKYVSFPHQVLAKSAKIIPVLIMGRIISKIKYKLFEYITVIILSCGMVFFMLDVESDRGSSAATTVSGLILLCSYLIFDSFTSNWQGILFNNYGMSSVQMMFCVNMFSITFTAVSLSQHGELISSINFMLKFPSFMTDCFLLSLCSAAGQLFIFKTIATFGPLVFAIITTIRQGLSVLLSCAIYGHQVHAMGIFGLFLIFFSIFLRIYCVYKTEIRYKYSPGIKM